MTLRRFAAAWLCLMPGLSVANAQESFEQTYELGDPVRTINLSKGLLEISGLAAGEGDTVYAHNDEHGIVYRINLQNGDILSAFALGDPTVKEDFEGVAVVGERVYLVTSGGLLYEAPLGKHRQRVRYNIFDTGAGAFCEIEGLAPGPAADEFLLLCKGARKQSLAARLVMFKWRLSDRRAVEEPWLNIPWADFLSPEEQKGFRPSALEHSRGEMLILSARNRLFLTLGPDGSVREKASLPVGNHYQAEGVALTSNGDLVIADEGFARRPGRLTIYRKK